MSKETIEGRIAQYEYILDMLRRTMFGDDPDWKDRAEELIKMLVEDRVEILRRKQEITGQSTDND